MTGMSRAEATAKAAVELKNIENALADGDHIDGLTLVQARQKLWDAQGFVGERRDTTADEHYTQAGLRAGLPAPLMQAKPQAVDRDRHR